MHTHGMEVLMACIALLHTGLFLTHAQECGDNPIKQVLIVAKQTGRTLSHVLTLLKEIDSPAYENLARKFRTYAACVGLVDTGYFRKRSGNDVEESNMHLQIAGEKYMDDMDEFNPRLEFDNRVDNPMYFADQDPDFDLGGDLDTDIEQTMNRDLDQFGIAPPASNSYILNVREKKSDLTRYENSKRYNVDRLKKWLYGPYRNYMNSYYIRWNLLWPLTKEEA